MDGQAGGVVRATPDRASRKVLPAAAATAWATCIPPWPRTRWLSAPAVFRTGAAPAPGPHRSGRHHPLQHDAVVPQPYDQIGHRLRRGSRGDRSPAFDREAYKQRNPQR
ncbi:hypothetical protein GCM10010524_30070 [Streptomyces mexicanus]